MDYEGALAYKSFGDRLNYLMLNDLTHESPRHISNQFYKSAEWRQMRRDIIKRDRGYDLGIQGFTIIGRVMVHHIDPLVEDDFIYWNVDKLLNPNNLITCSEETHNTIHYRRRESGLYVERRPGDTKLW